nr:kell blood group glycoprotein isoform X1 [Nothobranchius furzeri]
MSLTSELEPQLSLHFLSQSEPERGKAPTPLKQHPPPTTDPHQLQEQIQLQPVLQPEPLSRHEHQEKPAWMKHQRVLLFMLGLTVWAAILGLIYYIHHNFHRQDAAAVPSCLSPACRWAEARLSTSTDPFTQPCGYFMSPCGSSRLLQKNRGRQRGQGIRGHPQNQMEKFVLPERQNGETSYAKLREDKMLSRKNVLLQYVREILESNQNSRSSAVQKTKDFYRSCLDRRSIETAGAEPFLQLIQKLGGWAVSGRWNKTDFNSTLGVLMRDYSTFPFFNLYVGKDPNETASGTHQRYIQIDQPDLLIPIEWNRKTEKSQANAKTLRPFLASCQKFLNLLGSPPGEIMIHVGSFISLSSELAVAASPRHYRLSKGQLHQRMTIKELQRRAPAIDWLGCLQTAFHPLSLSEDDHVLLHNLPYIVQMSRTVNKWLNRHELSNSGPLHTFMIFNLLHTLMPAMDSRFSETAKNYTLALGHSVEEVPLWRHCVLETERGFDSVLTHLLGQKTALREAEEMIENVFDSLKSKLNELKWVDRNSSELVMQKVNSLIPRLRSSEEVSGGDDLDIFFSKVTIRTNSFFSNYLQLLSLWQNRRSKLLTAPIEAADVLSVTPFSLDAELLFPMGMFIPPFFHPTYPKAMNYGAVGFLIAKDIFHLLVPEIYYHSRSVHTVGKCVWSYYINATERASRDGVSALSTAQLQEVWVQHAALQVALQAYHLSLSQNSSDTSLAGMHHDHLLLRSFSQVNCDADPFSESMPLDPSFLIAVVCSTSDLCPTSPQCSIKSQQNSSHAC